MAEITVGNLADYIDGSLRFVEWTVADGKRVSARTVIAVIESSNQRCELAAFHDGFLRHRISVGDPIEPDTPIAIIVELENPVSLEFALKRIHEGDPQDHDLVMSAITLYESAEEIDNLHLLRCLDYGGSVAAWGARGLYAKTRRDGIDRFSTSDLFSTDRSGWEEFLATAQDEGNGAAVGHN